MTSGICFKIMQGLSGGVEVTGKGRDEAGLAKSWLVQLRHGHLAISRPLSMTDSWKILKRYPNNYQEYLLLEREIRCLVNEDGKNDFSVFCTTWILYHESVLSLYKHKLIFKKSPNWNNKLQSEVLIILFIQEVPLFHLLPKNSEVPSPYLRRGRSVSWRCRPVTRKLVDGCHFHVVPECSQDTHDAQASAQCVPKLSGMGVCVGWPVRQLGTQRWCAKELSP